MVLSKLQLSDNDKSEIKMYAKGSELSSLAVKSLTILSYLFRGLHNSDRNQLAKFDFTNTMMCQYVMFGSMATWDDNKLTTLVVLAHKLAIRVELSPRAFRYVRLSFSERKREGASYDRHPTIEEVVQDWSDYGSL